MIIKHNSVTMKGLISVLENLPDLKKHNKFISQVSNKQKRLRNTHRPLIQELLILLNQQELSLLHYSGPILLNTIVPTEAQKISFLKNSLI